ELGQAHRRRRLDGGDGIDAADIVAADAAAVIDLEDVGVEGEVLQPGELVEIDRELVVELALADGAAPVAAGDVGEQVVGPDEIIGDAAGSQRPAGPPGIAVGGQAGG